jgi:hypothetical protein
MDSKSTSRDFPGFDKIFSLGEPGTSRSFRGDINLKSKEVFGLTRAEIQPPHPIKIEWAMGRARPIEVIWTTMGTAMIIADSVVEMLRSHGFTGWGLYDLTVQDKQGQPVPGYSGLSVPGRCGNLEQSMSVQVQRICPGGVLPFWKGLLFEPTTWDGSDFFMPARKTGFIFVVEAVKQAFEQAKIRDVRFTALDQFERSWTV